MKRKGMTLVEILLAMMLLAMVFSSVVAFIVTTKKWSAQRNTKTLQLEVSGMSVLSAEFNKLNYSNRNSIADTVDTSMVGPGVASVQIFRMRPDLDNNGTRPADAPVLAFVVVRSN